MGLAGIARNCLASVFSITVRRSHAWSCLCFLRLARSVPSRSLRLRYHFDSQLRLALRFCVLSSSASVQTPSPMASCVLDSIELTELERRIFDTLKAVLTQYNLRTQLRVAGGWVRDKLLGKECLDIDVALDDMMGREFCEKLNEYLLSVGEEVHGVCVIPSNPDQSKHLETARVKLFGIWIDFVNLRSESYSEDSRIPTRMEFGTAEEDAYRRDLTINSLFYNINTCCVEDLTGRGISHLKDGIIATPLPAKKTFLDDPLRVLRAIRFCARFNYKLHDDVRVAASDKEVNEALANKISRERVGHEVDLMLKNHLPVKAIEEMVSLGIFWTVFEVPEKIKSFVPKDKDRACLNTLEAVYMAMKFFGEAKFTAEEKRVCYLGSLMLPLRSFQYKEKQKMVLLSDRIIKESLKLKARDAEMVVDLHKAVEAISNTSSLDEGHVDSVNAGLILMGIKGLWRVALLLSSVIELPVKWTTELPFDDKKALLKDKIDRSLAFEAAISKLGLENVWERKPLLDGNTIMSEIGLHRGGPEIKEWQQCLLRWQLSNLDGNVDECLEWFRFEKAKRQRSS